MQSAYDLVRLAAERSPHHPAIIDDLTDRRLTYAELMKEIDIVAAGLADRGIGPKDRLAVVLPSLYEHYLLVMATQRLGAVPALINPRLNTEEIVALIREGAMKGAVVTARTDLITAIQAMPPENAFILVVGDCDDQAIDHFGACRGEPRTLPSFLPPKPEENAFIFYTSGTSGLPKGVMIPHRAVEPRSLFIATQGGIHHGFPIRALGIAPAHHVIGFFGVFLLTLAFSGAFFVMSAFSPDQAVDLIERHDITYLFAVPTHFQAIVSAAGYSPDKVRSVKLLLFAGALIHPALLDRLAEEWTAARLVHIYGTTEVMCALYHPSPAGHHDQLRPAFYTRVRAIHIDGTPDDMADIGEEAELIVDTAITPAFTGYLNDVKTDKLREGWYYTGDVVRLNADGEYTFIGRADDMIRTGGEAVYPAEVEAVLTAYEAVKEAAVIGIPDAYWGEMVFACVVLNNTVSISELDRHCRSSNLAGYKRPKGYLICEALPKNAANKVVPAELRSLVAEKQDSEAFQIISRT